MRDHTPYAMGGAEYQFLLKLSNSIRPLSNTEEIKQCVCKMLCETMPAERACYAEISGVDDAMINVCYQRPGIAQIHGSFELDRFGKDLVERLRSGETLIMRDIQQEPSLSAEERHAYASVGVQSYIAVPLIKQSTLMAVLSINASAPRQWSERDAFLLRKAADRTWETVERARAERALSLTEIRSQQIFDSIDQGMCIIKMVYDANGKPIDYIFLHTNAAFASQTGLVNVIGKGMRELAPQHEQFWFDTYARIDQTGVPERFEHKADALKRFYEVYGFRIDEPEQHTVGLLFKDISPRIAAEQALIKANKAKDDFLAVVSHELRNPLNLILLNAELLGRLPEADTQPIIQRTAETLSRTVKNLATVVDDLLDLSRINTGKLALQCSQCHLETLVQKLVTSFQDEADQNTIALSFELQPGIVIHADSTRIEQVIWNLLSNALKFTPAGGAIDISLSARDDWAVLKVSDTGQGIPGEVLPYVFDMFVQEDSSSSRINNGLGIGLALVKQIVELHQGKVEALSQGKGTGASFRICLPLSHSATQETSQATPGLDRPLHLLLVEDNRSSAELLSQLLTLEGYAVDVAFDGQSGLDQVANAKYSYDLILSDIDMPGMDGFQLARLLREHEKTATTPLIAVTGIPIQGSRDKLYSAGFNDVVSKPITIAAIHSAVKNLLR
ncbi:ATP-binding protein [Methylobacillus pratensis]